MRTLAWIAAFALVVQWSIGTLVDRVESQTQQAMALKCATNPDMPGCGAMATAAGNPSEE